MDKIEETSKTGALEHLLSLGDGTNITALIIEAKKDFEKLKKDREDALKGINKLFGEYEIAFKEYHGCRLGYGMRQDRIEAEKVQGFWEDNETRKSTELLIKLLSE